VRGRGPRKAATVYRNDIKAVRARWRVRGNRAERRGAAGTEKDAASIKIDPRNGRSRNIADDSNCNRVTVGENSTVGGRVDGDGSQHAKVQNNRAAGWK